MEFGFQIGIGHRVFQGADGVRHKYMHTLAVFQHSRDIRAGLINRVVPGEQLDAYVREMAERLAAKPTKVLGWAKHLLHSAVENGRSVVLEQEGLFVELNIATADSQERTAAMREKRDPTFRGF